MLMYIHIKKTKTRYKFVYTGCFTKNGPQKNDKYFWKKEKFYQNYFENQKYNLLLLETNKLINSNSLHIAF